MTSIKMLSDLPELRNSGYGRPPPRHGLHLLYWFCTTCVTVTHQDEMLSLCSPHSGDFGFRTFHNRDEKNKGRLLPESNDPPYYELGNLSAAGVRKTFPEYVRERYTGFRDKSNTDRIIVCYDYGSGFFNGVYVTRHENQASFNRKHTYCIHPGLIRSIQSLEREDFLRETRQRRHRFETSRSPTTYQATTNGFNCTLSFCTSENQNQTLHQIPEAQKFLTLPVSSHQHSRRLLIIIFVLLFSLLSFFWKVSS